jgi:hypothetical protein
MSAYRGLVATRRAQRLNIVSNAIDRRASRRSNRLKAKAMMQAARATGFHRQGAMRARLAAAYR